MTFDIHQLDKLSHEEVEALLYDYIDAVEAQFEASPEGQSYAADYPDTGGWIRPFIELGYTYEGATPPKTTLRDARVLMESVLPRKITIMEASEAEEAVPELIAFWSYLSREYRFSQAAAIITYLQSIQGKFGEWMVDPARGGMAKNFIMSGMQAGYDMTSEAGLTAYQQAYNAELLGQSKKTPLKQSIANLFGAAPSPSGNRSLALSSQPAKKTPEVKSKGFGAAVKPKASRRKKR